MTFKEFCERLVDPSPNAYISLDNHTFDNSFIEVDAFEMWRSMERDKLELLGISFEPPCWKYSEKDIAFIFRDLQLEEILWIHLSRISWEHYVLNAFGRKNADRIISDVCSRDHKEADVHGT